MTWEETLKRALKSGKPFYLFRLWEKWKRRAKREAANG